MKPSFYLPVIRPPEGLVPNTILYFSYFTTLLVDVAVASGADGLLEIQVKKPAVVHPVESSAITAFGTISGQPDPVSTVFAMTSGFVGFGLDAGTQTARLTLKVWTGHFQNLTKSPDGSPRANRIIYGGLDSESVKNAMRKQISSLSLGILNESWSQGGSGQTPARQALEEAILQRFLGGDCEIYVEAGAALGTGSLGMAGNDPIATLTLKAVFDAAGATAEVPASTEDLIDTALRPKHLVRFAGHPLLKALSEAMDVVHFKSRFLVWDNTSFDYVPLASTNVTLHAGADLAALPGALSSISAQWLTLPSPAETDPSGYIEMDAPLLLPRSVIHFECETAGKTYGSRTYVGNVKTTPHKARLHVDENSENHRIYKVKHEILPGYKEFTDDLADHEADEKFGADRGSMGVEDKNIDSLPLSPSDALLALAPNVLPAIGQRDYMKHIARFEACYRADVIPAASDTFNVLFEGDSWLNYPFAFNDIYGHLDQILWAKTKSTVTYNRIPLQHYGDRSDQMFYATVPNSDRQIRHTLDFLSEYPFNLIFISGGGNDMAEPGISGSVGDPYKDFVVNGYFDPSLAKVDLNPGQMSLAERAMQKSFAVLLKNHGWHAYFNPSVQLLDEAGMSALLQPLLTAVLQTLPTGEDFGPDDALEQSGSLQEIGEKVIRNFPPNYITGGPEDQLIQAVFEPVALAQRYDQVKSNLKILLDAAQPLGIPVITHTYGYPLFNEEATSALSMARMSLAGPWFNNRFREAKILDRRIQKICLKMILDRYVIDVLEPLKNQYPLFDYVDVRNLNPSTDVWRDEMHLRGSGYRKVAEKIYDAIAANSALSGFFGS